MRSATRREFLKTAGAGAGFTGLVVSAQPALGLIFPPAVWPSPLEAAALYPDGVRFPAAGIGIGRTLPEEFDRLSGRIAPVANRLAREGANAIALLSPPLSFYNGAAFNQRLSREISGAAAGLPAITASTAMVEGLGTLGARRIAVATVYTDEINLRLQGFLNESGFEVVIVKGLGIERFEERAPVTQAVTPAEIVEFIAGVRESRPEADALLLAFGYLPTLDLIAPLEKRCQIPVVSAVPHALRAGVRLLGMSGRSAGFGTLFDKP